MKALILGLRGLSFWPERTDYRPERADLGPERADLGPQGGWMDIWMDVRTDIWKFTPVSYRILALWGRCPKKERVFSQTSKLNLSTFYLEY